MIPQKIENVLSHFHSLHLIFRCRYPLLRKTDSHHQLHQSSLLSLSIPCLHQQLSLGILIQVRVPHLVHWTHFGKVLGILTAFTGVRGESPLAWIIEVVSYVITCLSSLYSLFSQQQPEWSDHILTQNLLVSFPFQRILSVLFSLM